MEKRGRGRPKGAKNKPKTVDTPVSTSTTSDTVVDSKPDSLTPEALTLNKPSRRHTGETWECGRCHAYLTGALPECPKCGSMLSW